MFCPEETFTPLRVTIFLTYCKIVRSYVLKSNHSVSFFVFALVAQQNRSRQPMNYFVIDRFVAWQRYWRKHDFVL